MRLPSFFAALTVASLCAATDVSAQTTPPPYTCNLPTLPAAPNPIPACQEPCDPFPPPGPACATCNFGSACTVTTMLELTSALNCRANSTTGQCAHITIPATATIAFCSTISIGNDRVHWGTLLGNTGVGIANEPYPGGCNGERINPCPADIDLNEAVDIDDLLAVISNWGACPAVGACWFDNICHPHWTASACAAAGGEYQGNGTDCWTHPASAPCCSLNQGNWTCAEDVLPFACWGSNKKYLGNEEDCIGVSCATAVSTMPLCTAACRFPQFPCSADIAPIEFGNAAVDIDDLLLVISNWSACGEAPEDFPNGLSDCFNIYCDGLTGEEWEECLEKCFEAYCMRFPEDCE